MSKMKKSVKKIIKNYFENNHKIELSTGCCWHIQEITEKYILLKDCGSGSEFKYFWNLDELEDLIVYNIFKQYPSRKRGWTCDCNIKISKSDIPMMNKNKKSSLKEVKKEILNLMKLKEDAFGNGKLWMSDVMNFVSTDMMTLMKSFNELNEEGKISEKEGDSKR